MSYPFNPDIDYPICRHANDFKRFVKSYFSTLLLLVSLTNYWIIGDKSKIII